MLIRPVELDALVRGDIDLAFRRWERPRLRVGTRMRTKIGLVEVTGVEPVTLRSITAQDARRAGAATRAELITRLADHPDRPVFRIGLRFAGVDPRIALRQDDVLSDEERAGLLARLDRWDGASSFGAWTRPTLQLIADNPAVRAPDLAARLGRPTLDFKRDVRRLKELGLTQSLDVGYLLAPRGRALLGLPTEPAEPADPEPADPNPGVADGTTVSVEPVPAAVVLETAELVTLYGSVGWTAYTRDPAMVAAAVAGSSRVVIARDGPALVGLARVITDGASICFLQDVLVHPDRQRAGIGGRLVRAALEPYAHVRQTVLLTDDDPGVATFYRALGFAETREHGDGTLRAFVRVAGD